MLQYSDTGMVSKEMLQQTVSVSHGSQVLMSMLSHLLSKLGWFWSDRRNAWHSKLNLQSTGQDLCVSHLWPEAFHSSRRVLHVRGWVSLYPQGPPQLLSEIGARRMFPRTGVLVHGFSLPQPSSAFILTRSHFWAGFVYVYDSNLDITPPPPLADCLKDPPLEVWEGMDRSWLATDEVFHSLDSCWFLGRSKMEDDVINSALFSFFFYPSLVFLLPLGTTLWLNSLYTSLFQAILRTKKDELTPLDCYLK